jgi:hypothetical protein
VSASCLGAAEGELPGAPPGPPSSGLSDQRLSLHQGPPQLTPRTLVLGGWHVVRSEAVPDERLTFSEGSQQ